MGWEVIPTLWAVHVVPQDDANDHTVDLHCHCHPRKEVASAGHLIVIHNAFDGRVREEETQAAKPLPNT